MSTITKQAVQAVADLKAGYTLGHADVAILNELARIALASLEAEPVAWLLSGGGAKNNVSFDSGNAYADPLREVTPLYTAPPAPVSMKDHQIREMVNELRDIAIEYQGTQQLRERIARTVRTAMLHGAEPVSNRDELPLDYLQGHKDGLEWAALLAEANHPQTGDWLYDDPVELAKAIRKGPDMPESRCGNSPVIPDGWVACSERLPPEGYETDGGAICYLVWHKNEVDCGPQYSISNVFFLRKHWEKNFTHWMPLPAAPKQEVTQALAKGMERYGDAMLKLAKKEDIDG